jgi:hypothetical protein
MRVTRLHRFVRTELWRARNRIGRLEEECCWGVLFRAGSFGSLCKHCTYDLPIGTATGIGSTRGNR